jgi:hypothetical protein
LNLFLSSEQAEDQPQSRSPSPTPGTATSASQALTALLARLSDANNRTMIDEVAVDFAFFNSKASRKRLVKVSSRGACLSYANLMFANSFSASRPRIEQTSSLILPVWLLF